MDNNLDYRVENAQLKDANSMLHAELERLGDASMRRLKHLQSENEVLRCKHRGHRAHIRRMQATIDAKNLELSMRYKHVSELSLQRNCEIIKRQELEAQVKRLNEAAAGDHQANYRLNAEVERLRAALEEIEGTAQVDRLKAILGQIVGQCTYVDRDDISHPRLREIERMAREALR